MTEQLRRSLAVTHGAHDCAFTIARWFVETLSDLADPETFERFTLGDDSKWWSDRAADCERRHAPPWREWQWRIAEQATPTADPEGAEAEWAEYVAEKLYEVLSDDAGWLTAKVGALAYERAREKGYEQDDADAIAWERMEQASEDYWATVDEWYPAAVDAVATTTAATLPTPRTLPISVPIPVSRSVRPRATRRARLRSRRRRRAAARSPGRPSADDPEPSRRRVAACREAGS